MKTYGEVDVYIHVLLDSALLGGEWSASLSGHFISRDRTPDAVEKSGNRNPAVQPVASRYTD
jgi:hypothetical protein